MGVSEWEAPLSLWGDQHFLLLRSLGAIETGLIEQSLIPTSLGAIETELIEQSLIPTSLAVQVPSFSHTQMAVMPSWPGSAFR